MLFSEIYGSYFNVVAEVLKEAAAGTHTDANLTESVREKAFAESVLTIPAALKSGEWPLLTPTNRTPLRHAPTMPLTTLQKRWLKALLLDPRIALFDPSQRGLEEVRPLYRPGTFVFYDQYTDGDPYTQEAYILNFRRILSALRGHRKMRIRFSGRTGTLHTLTCIPYRLEYSEKDDKFRLLVAERGMASAINLARIHTCEVLEPYGPNAACFQKRDQESLVFLLNDERNALERVLLHFSHLRKETSRLDARTYQVRLFYERDDETELLIRILSFGPMIQVISPDSFIRLIKERLNKQKNCGL